MKNIDIREEMIAAKVKYWEVADVMGKDGPQFSVMLRKEMTPEQKRVIRSAIAVVRRFHEEKGEDAELGQFPDVPR